MIKSEGGHKSDNFFQRISRWTLGNSMQGGEHDVCLDNKLSFAFAFAFVQC